MRNFSTKTQNNNLAHYCCIIISVSHLLLKSMPVCSLFIIVARKIRQYVLVLVPVCTKWAWLIVKSQEVATGQGKVQSMLFNHPWLRIYFLSCHTPNTQHTTFQQRNKVSYLKCAVCGAELFVHSEKKGKEMALIIYAASVIECTGPFFLFAFHQKQDTRHLSTI